eukprot:CAMPEP_0168564122 /NCGR_PEP_ID=MMETSP0413-20121227/13060_1 /TAXON_ID=136452 /ORGANISM="Filamoeba nolandi, Strain NC-AS-23-1" /LENGTH=239 /DNA_ID=CAMNT_0008595739 /DNA_START=1 /DNA_END=720 /DNA_ORIENTATION=-
MDAQKTIEEWVAKVFQVVGLNLPHHLLQYYAQSIQAGKISYQQVQNEAVEMVKPRSAVSQAPAPVQIIPQDLQHTSTKPAVVSSIPNIMDEDPERLKIKSQIEAAKGSTSSGQVDKVKEYVNQLYITYTGKLGDPASSQFIINSILDGSYSLQQAEFAVKFSKEAKNYQKTQAQRKQTEQIEQVTDYVRELFRVYLKKIDPPKEELDDWVQQILDGSRTLQDTEDEFRLLSITPPGKHK